MTEGFYDQNLEEIDESLLSHIDGHQVWVFGIIERRTGEARCWVVKDRSAQTLIPFIQEHIPPGSTIYSDGYFEKVV